MAWVTKARSRALSHGSLFDRLLVIRSLKNSVHENSRCVHAIGRQRSQFDQLFHFGDHIVRRRRHHGIEIPGGLAIDEVSPAAASPPLLEPEIPPQTPLQNISSSIEL